MNGLERRIKKLEQQTGAGEPIELIIRTGVPRIGDDEGVVRLWLTSGIGMASLPSTTAGMPALISWSESVPGIV
jgi:hypothetical protein